MAKCDKHIGMASDVFEMNKPVKDLSLLKFIGKDIRYKKEFRGTVEYGTISIDGIWKIEHTQKNNLGKEILRGYQVNCSHIDEFGRPFSPDEIEII